jgi:hypothetical protein
MQVQFSDTARADFEQLQDDAESRPDALTGGKSACDQIAEAGSAASDRVLPASSPDLTCCGDRSEANCTSTSAVLNRPDRCSRVLLRNAGGERRAVHCRCEQDGSAPPKLLDLQVRIYGMEARRDPGHRRRWIRANADLCPESGVG